jgi:LPXTG-motif cell wall-anchored protein
MGMRTIDGRRRLAAVVVGTATAAGLVVVSVGASAASAEEPLPDETTVPETTVPPGPTVAGLTTTEEATAVTTTPTTSPTIDDPGAEPTTPTSAGGTPLVPPADTGMTCEQVFGPYEYDFLVEDTIESGDTFDDAGSDFSVTFTHVEFVTDHWEVAFDTSHPVSAVSIGVDGLEALETLFFSSQPDLLSYDLSLNPIPGEVTHARFCFVDASAIGAPEPPAPTTGTSVAVGGPGGEVTPVTVTPVLPPVPSTDAEPVSGRLPETGNDVLPLALAGAGLVAVGGALLLGRRARRAGGAHA